MKKMLSIVLIFLSGCAIKPQTPQYKLDKQANQAVIQSGKPVEIFYHDDSYVILDGGGSKSLGLMGLLGPVGFLVGMTTDAAHRLDMKSRTERRSKEFSALIAQDAAERSINREFAQQIADLLAKEGRVVKVTKVLRPVGSADLARSASEDLVPTDGYMQLLLRLGMAYVATSATDTYKPGTMVEYALKDSDGGPLMSRSDTRIYHESDKTFLTYAGLLEDHKAAREELGARLSFWGEPVYAEIFRFPDPVQAK